MLVDNACSAVSKIVVAITENNMSSGLSQGMGGAQTCGNIVSSILPTLLQGLPLLNDHEEDGPGKRDTFFFSPIFFFSLVSQPLD